MKLFWISLSYAGECPTHLSANGLQAGGVGELKLLRMDQESKADERKEERKARPPQSCLACC